jgi:hypothetical protein
MRRQVLTASPSGWRVNLECSPEVMRVERNWEIGPLPPHSASIGDPPFCSGQRPSKWRPCSVEHPTRSRKRSWSPAVMP